MSEELGRLSKLLIERNAIDDKISGIIGRPAKEGGIGEFIASKIFNITLNKSATEKGHDGIFSEGNLKGKTVNVKMYGKREGSLDLKPEFPLDYYLVLTGPKTNSNSSRGTSRPIVIESVFLFDSQKLYRELTVKINSSDPTSVKQRFWQEAEIYPNQTNKSLILNEEQKSALRLFM